MATDVQPKAPADDSPQVVALKANKANLEARIKALTGAKDGDHDEAHQLDVAKAHLAEVNKELGTK